VPDALCGGSTRYGKRNFLMEFKAEKGTLTPPQIAFHRDWRGQVAIVKSVDELMQLLKTI
jgi:hypothetical protein